ncbi:BTAD domain-containing putative transcriptional regulator [Kitasatospora sp. NPDC048365]|uniref:AfsR/SARP family transcriptional regulator n=1 Tax=Kitasatospora sp. NPDC048365 TaxID=3364050 RepID=UPI00371617C1
MVLRYQLLGPVRVFDDDREVDAGPAKQRAVLAMLLGADGRFLPRGEIVRGVWGDLPPATAPQLVATYVARLRKAIEPDRAYRSSAAVLLSRGEAYALPADRDRLDAWSFEQERRAARRCHEAGDLAGSAAALGRSLALWNGRALDGIPGPSAARERHRLEELRLATEEERFAVRLEQGLHHESVPELSALAAAHPCRERVRALLMLALHRADRRAEALAVFQDAWRTLVDQAGVEPGWQLRDLQRRILDGDPTLHLSPAGGSAALRPSPSQLPPEVPDFTGRQAELAVLRRISAPSRSSSAPSRGNSAPATRSAPRLAVVTGPGGIGKTAFAVHAAHRLGSRYPDGRLHAHLHGGGERPVPPTEILARLLEDLGLPGDRVPAGFERRLALYRTVTAGRRLLILLDDAEHSAQVEPLLPASAESLVLVTSRSLLPGLATRTVLRLGALDDADARGLLRKAVGPERVDDETASVEEVLDVCAGYPLALRIVAARVTGRPAGAFGLMARRLRDEERRLGELRAGGLEVSAGLRVSYDGLPDREAASAFRLLSELAAPDLGVPTAAAALGIPDHRAEDHLETLTDAHLIEAARPDRGERFRYRFHDLLKVFGRSLNSPAEREAALTGMLGRLTRTHLAAVHAADLLLRPGHSAGSDFRGPGTPFPEHRFTDAEDALHWLEAERPTVVGTALQAAAAGAVEPYVLAELTTRLRAFLQRRGHWQDWEQLAGRTVRLARTGPDPDPLAEAIGRLELGTLAAARRRHAEATTELLSAIRLFGLHQDSHRQARAYNNLGLVYLELGLHTPSTVCLSRALAVHRAAGQPVDTAIALDNLALLHLRRGVLDRAEQYCEESIRTYRHNGTPELASAALNILGLVRGRQRRHPEAVDCQLRSRSIAQAQGNLYREAFALLDLAAEHRTAGEHGEAIACAEQGLALRQRLGDPQGTATAYTELAAALDAAGHGERATACRHQAEGLLVGHRAAVTAPVR